MKVFLSGYGKMGRMLEELALEHGWEVVGHADITCPEAYETAPGADVCLDFSGVGALQPLLGYLHRTKTALVSGTTGLTEPDLDALQELGRELPVIWTANYSTGIAVFRRMLHDYAGVLAGWDKEIVEIHHNQKADAPSGTAKLLLQELDPEGTATVLHGREGLCGKRKPEEAARWVKVSWVEGSLPSYQTSLELSAKDRDGLTLDVAMTLSAAKVKTTSLSARSMPDGYATVSIVLEVKNQEELTNVINKLGQIQGVYQVKRAAG